MSTSIHPLRLLARIDTDVTTIFHSFFLINILVDANDESSRQMKVVRRIPSFRDRIETIQSGLELFVLDAVSKEKTDDAETFGNFVVTTSEGARSFAFWKSYKNKVFVAVSPIPLLTFCRRLFEYLRFEDIDHLFPLLLCLTEAPILPGPGLNYDVNLTAGSIPINFSSVEQPDDEDINFIALSLFSPKMLVSAWESLILEHKVLVVSSDPGVIGACCEFLRRMVAPLSIINTYVPYLPALLIDTVEAPIPYLLGADIETLFNNRVDLSDTVVIDLDSRSVIPPSNKSANPKTPLPRPLISKLEKDINTILLSPMGSWYNRPNSLGRPLDQTNNPKNTNTNSNSSKFSNSSNFSKNSSPSLNEINLSPMSPHSVNHRAMSILQLFIRSNLSLLCARGCSVRAFFRRPSIANEDPIFSEMLEAAIPIKKKSSSGSMGFDRRHDIAYGFLQLGLFVNNISGTANSGDGDENGLNDNYPHGHSTHVHPHHPHTQLNQQQHTQQQPNIPCWCEMDEIVFAVYEHADEFPILYIPCRDIESVSPLPREPEGQVFEIVTKQQVTHSFTTHNADSRKSWISFIEEKKTIFSNIFPDIFTDIFFSS